jgi:hypothetical protein
MSFQFAIDPRSAVVHVTAHGPVDYWKVVEAITELSGAVHYEPEFDVYADVRDVDYVATPEEIADIAAQLHRYADVFRKKIAVVVPVSAVEAATRLSDLASRTSAVSIGVFTHPDDGYAWLGLR